MRCRIITGLGRVLDPRYPSNLAILLLFATATLTVGLSTGDGWIGFRAGCAVFFAWALTRELYPESELAAFASVALVTPFVVWSPAISAGPLFWLLLTVRIVNRTSGATATWLDVALVLWLAEQAPGAPWLLLLTALAFHLSAWLHGLQRKYSWYAAAALLLAVWASGTRPFEFASNPLGAAVALAASVWLLLERTGAGRTPADSGEPLVDSAVRAGRLWVGLAVLLLAFQGEEAVLGLLPLWTAVWGHAVYQAFGGARRSKAPSPLSGS